MSPGPNGQLLLLLRAVVPLAFFTGSVSGMYASQLAPRSAWLLHLLLRASDQAWSRAPSCRRATCELGAQEPIASCAAAVEVASVRMPALARVAGTKLLETVQMQAVQKSPLLLAGLPADRCNTHNTHNTHRVCMQFRGGDRPF